MNEKLMFTIKAKSEGVSKSLKTVSDGLRRATTRTNEASSGMKKWSHETKKLNDKFTNLNKDINRSANGIGKISKSLGGLKNTFNIYMIANALGKVINSSIEAIETMNLFKVALGDASTESEELVQKLSSVYGLDPTNIRNAFGSYALLARSMGMTSDQAKILSSNTYQLALDLSSLTNVPINQVLGDLRSGLLGQSETVYKYGIDVTEASLKTEALAQGISKSVREMSQGEKMALRYSVMLRQASLSTGDFAKTIYNPANQLKILAERFITLGRSIGNIFLPLLQIVLPWINALMTMLINLSNVISKFFGYTEDMGSDVGGLGGSDSIGTGYDDLTDSANDATGAIKDTTKANEKLKKSIMGFDQVNILSKPKEDTSSSGGNGGTGGGVGGMGGSILDTLKLADVYGGFLDKLTSTNTQLEKLKALFKQVSDAAEPTRDALQSLWDNALSKMVSFTFGTLMDFYNSFLIPVGKWALGSGIPSFLGIIETLLSGIDWDKLRTSLDTLYSGLAKFTTNFFDGFLGFFEGLAEKLKPYVAQALEQVGIGLSGIGTALENMDEKDIQKFGELVASLLTIVTIVKTLTLVGTAIEGMGVALGKLTAPLEVLTTGGMITAFTKLAGGLGNVLLTQGAYLPAYWDTFVELLPSSWQESLDSMGTKFDTFWDNLYEKTGINSLVNAIGDGIGAFADGMGKGITDWFSTYDLTADIFRYSVDSFKKAFKSDNFIEFGKNIVDGILLGITGVMGIISEPLLDLILFESKDDDKRISSFAKSIGTKINTAFSSAKTNVKNVVVSFSAKVTTTASTIKSKWNGIASYWKNKTSTFATKVSTTTSKVKSWWGNVSKYWKNKTAQFSIAVKTSASSIKSFINSVIRSINANVIAKLDFNIKAPKWLGGGFSFKAPRIPQLAKGGIVDSGQIYQAGEAGKEAIVPLERNTQWMDMVSQKLGSENRVSKNDMKNAFKEALKETNMGDTVLYVDSQMLARATNKGQKLINRRTKLVLN